MLRVNQLLLLSVALGEILQIPQLRQREHHNVEQVVALRQVCDTGLHIQVLRLLQQIADTLRYHIGSHLWILLTCCIFEEAFTDVGAHLRLGEQSRTHTQQSVGLHLQVLPANIDVLFLCVVQLDVVLGASEEMVESAHKAVLFRAVALTLQQLTLSLVDLEVVFEVDEAFLTATVDHEVLVSRVGHLLKEALAALLVFGDKTNEVREILTSSDLRVLLLERDDLEEVNDIDASLHKDHQVLELRSRDILHLFMQVSVQSMNRAYEHVSLKVGHMADLVIMMVESAAARPVKVIVLVPSRHMHKGLVV